MQNGTIWRNCSNDEMLEILAQCPEVVEEMKKIGYNDLINSYDALLPKYNMDRLTTPVHKENSDDIEGFGYWYRVDDKEYGVKDGATFSSKAEAQMASIRETMSELQQRILKARL